MPGYTSINPQAINQAAQARKQAVLNSAGNDPFAKAEFARVANSVYDNAQTSETGRLARLRNDYFRTPTANSEYNAAQQWQAQMYGQQMQRQQFGDILGYANSARQYLGQAVPAAYYLWASRQQKPQASQLGGLVGNGIGQGIAPGLAGY